MASLTESVVVLSMSAMVFICSMGLAHNRYKPMDNYYKQGSTIPIFPSNKKH
jgi:hypothetical protein